MFSHVMLGVNDLEVSKKFYDALLGMLGIAPGVANKNRHARQWQHHRVCRDVAGTR